MDVVLSVDLAARLSAVVLRGTGGEVLHQFDSRTEPSLDFCQRIANGAQSASLIVVEDVPYGVTSQAMVKPVLRLQGALIACLMARGALSRTIFMSPSTWMRDYPGTQQATTKGLSKTAADQERIETAAFHAKRAGYTPPDLVAAYITECQVAGMKVLKKDTNVLAKSMTDYVSAWLMSEFTRQFSLDQLLAMPGVQRATL